MIEAGTVLQNRYRVEKQIGQGGMGAVFVATDERFGSTVAIKETFFTDEKFRKAFEREARLLNSLRHPALPRVSDHFIDGNGQFLVMEFIDGDDLSEQLESEGKVFSVEEVLGWADQLLDALEFLHTQEMPVIHRDIKPQNLKLTSRGQIILLDFGLAKGNITNAESATAAKSVFGYSRNYASIEQIQGSGTDPRSDLYSLAATLYHLLTGIPPADALTRAMNVLSDKPDPLIEANRIRPEIPAGVSRVLLEAMALNAEQRPPTAKEMRARLLAVKDEVPLENAETFEGSPLGTNIYSQKTQLQSDASKISNFKQSDILTETFPNDESKVTQIKPQVVTGDLEEKSAKIYPLAATAEDGKKSRRGLAIGAALGSLLVAACTVFGFYVYKPEVFGLSNNPSNTDADKKVIMVQVPPDNVNLAEANANTENSNALAQSPSNANVSTETKPKETVARTETKQPETKTKTETPA
ncbi:MAG TPA: serine/threonine-protein kinase, partial [Pyrinomonadaceae bacterium]|nr:serine/threonine-protein kinase [Pyrinomonadaceae bacterium]